MTEENILMLCLMEECAEVQQCLSKVMRFGLNTVHEGKSNKERLVEELHDLVAVGEMLSERGIISDICDDNRISKKKDKVMKFMAQTLENNK